MEGTDLTDEVNQYEGVSQRYVGKQIVSSLKVKCTHAVTLRETLATDNIWVDLVLRKAQLFLSSEHTRKTLDV